MNDGALSCKNFGVSRPGNDLPPPETNRRGAARCARHREDTTIFGLTGTAYLSACERGMKASSPFLSRLSHSGWATPSYKKPGASRSGNPLPSLGTRG